jgi:hypothetical protein
MTAATKTKKTKVEDLRPPMEIRDNTKVRREWLASKLAEVNARVGFEGRIVGNGSYQSVSVYSVTEVAGRLRYRGHCQFCGNAQVVDNGVLVLHGYSRPGIGYVFNECPCVGRKPLEAEQKLTEDYLVQARAELARLEQELEQAMEDERAALSALFPQNKAVEDGAYSACPRSVSRKPTPEQTAEYNKAMKTWAKKFPLTAGHKRAEARKSQLSTLVWRTKQRVEHFELLLSKKLLGQLLIEEVVVEGK